MEIKLGKKGSCKESRFYMNLIQCIQMQYIDCGGVEQGQWRPYTMQAISVFT